MAIDGMKLGSNGTGVTDLAASEFTRSPDERADTRALLRTLASRRGA